MRLKGKIAIVTGSGQGLGKAIGLAFAKEGCNVVVNDINPKTAEEVVKEIKNLHCKSFSIIADTSNKKEVQVMVDKTLAEFGRIDLLVNNAGISAIAPSEDLSEELWDRAIGINLKGVFLCSQATGRIMIQQKQGKIINMASMTGFAALPKRLAYCSSKAGVISMTKVLAIEWAKHNINVNAIAPGYIKTKLVADVIARKIMDKETLVRRIPIGRLGTPEDVAKIAVFLASSESDYVTGETILVDGGWQAYGAW